MNEIYVAKDGRETGPFQEDQIVSMLDAGMLALTDSVWHKDVPGWIPVHQFLGRRPPLPDTVSHPVASGAPNRSGELASFGRRFGALVVDSVLWLFVGSMTGGFVAGVVLGESMNMMSNEEFNRFTLVPALVVAWLYSAGMESSPIRATVGKLLFGLIVTDTAGKPLTFWRATLRFAGKFIVAPTLGFSWLPCAWTARKQALHDLLSGTLVLRK